MLKVILVMMALNGQVVQLEATLDRRLWSESMDGMPGEAFPTCTEAAKHLFKFIRPDAEAAAGSPMSLIHYNCMELT